MSERAHPGAETIAEYQAGATGGVVLLRAFQRRRLAAHLARCAQCSSLASQVRQVSVVLAATPQPPIPVGVAERLVAALAAEASARTASSGVRASGTVLAAATGSPDDGGSHRSSGEGRWGQLPRRALVPAALGALVVLGGGGYLLSRQGNPAGPYSAGPAPVQGHAASPSVQGGVRIGPDHVGVNHSTLSTNGTSPGYRVVSTGTVYQPATLRTQVSHELTASAKAATITAPANLASCVRRVAGIEHLVFVDVARYKGELAFVIASAGHAWVTSATCSSAKPDLVASVALGS